jgi:hypothetical protein
MGDTTEKSPVARRLVRQGADEDFEQVHLLAVSTPLQVWRLAADFPRKWPEIEGSVQLRNRPDCRRSMQPLAGSKQSKSHRSRSPNARSEFRLYQFDRAPEPDLGGRENQSDSLHRCVPFVWATCVGCEWCKPAVAVRLRVQLTKSRPEFVE